jgi:hypothetical protein
VEGNPSISEDICARSVFIAGWRFLHGDMNQLLMKDICIELEHMLVGSETKATGGVAL